MEFFLNIKKRQSHENERKIVPKAIVPEPPSKTYLKSLSPIFSKFLQSSQMCFVLFFSFSNFLLFSYGLATFFFFSLNCVSVSRKSSARTSPV